VLEPAAWSQQHRFAAGSSDSALQQSRSQLSCDAAFTVSALREVAFSPEAPSQLSGDIAFSPDGGVPEPAATVSATPPSQLSGEVAYSPEAPS
jgi:hypothetical protein